MEQLARELDPSHEQRKQMASQVMAYAEDYLNSLPNRLTYDHPPENFAPEFPIEEQPVDLREILEMLHEQVNSKGINPASGGHLGYIPGGGLVPSAWGDFLADITNRYSGIYFASPGGVRMENTLVRWLCQLIGYDEKSGGTLTSGGSLANLTAIVNARDAHQIKAADISKSVIYYTAQIHHCAHKALHIAGLSECQIREVPMIDFRMNVEQLAKLVNNDLQKGLKPFMVMASAGTTEAGVVDPLEDIADVALENNIWYHIDAAYGGFFLLTDYGKKVLKGIEKADSVIIDPHKGMFLPYGSGAVLVKDQLKLYHSQHYFANYMQDAIPAVDEMSPADLSPELSRHFRGMRMWLPLRLFGVGPFRAALEEKLWLARYFYERLVETGLFEVGPSPELSVTFFRYVPPEGSEGSIDEFNQRLVELIKSDGRVFFSSTTLNGKFYLRLAVLNFRTHLEQIDLAMKILLEKIELL
ncbi:MAG: aminotransferase class V-fold PLP-dependent enzyme [Cyclobacteriaceae bacterium]|nr:aminotransferase class V-fold PLP-dependent enzyme [Cyclobacteriaceae bacterium]